MTLGHADDRQHLTYPTFFYHIVHVVAITNFSIMQ